MKIKTLLIVALALCLTSSLALADTTVTGSGDWQSFVAGNINQSGAPYWDQVSLDQTSPQNAGQPSQNVGAFLTATQFFAGGTNYLGSGPQFWGNAYNSGADTGGGADPSFFLTTDQPSSVNTFLLRITAADGTDAIGIYDTGTLAQTQIFGPGNAVGATTTVTLTSPFGFYGISPQGTFYSESANNSTNQGQQHFALFRDSTNSGVFYVGFEDLPGDTGIEHIGDFNDLVIQFTPVPIPPTALLMGCGLLGLVGLGWRRRKSY